jgi:hypothetical protein
MTREEILAVNDCEIETLHVRAWKKDVFVRGMSAKDFASYQSSNINIAFEAGVTTTGVTLDNNNAKIAVRCLCDKNGKRLFSDDDAAVLGEKSAKALAEIVPVASRLSGMGENGVEQQEKNFEPGLSAVSTSG